MHNNDTFVLYVKTNFIYAESLLRISKIEPYIFYSCISLKLLALNWVWITYFCIASSLWYQVQCVLCRLCCTMCAEMPDIPTCSILTYSFWTFIIHHRAQGIQKCTEEKPKAKKVFSRYIKQLINDFWGENMNVGKLST